MKIPTIESNKLPISAPNELSSQSKTDQIKESVTPNQSSSSKASPQSSHLALLGLAKQFSLVVFSQSSKEQDSLAERARKREQSKRMRQQQNLEKIIQIALGYASTEHPSNRIDIDWFSSFLSLAENVSNPSMQELWSKILMAEIANPGTFSFKTMTTFKAMNINEAKVFSKACSLAVRDKSTDNLRLLTGYYLQPSLSNSFVRNKHVRINLNQYGLSFANVLLLSNMGILYSEEIESKSLDKGVSLPFNYNGLPFSITAKRHHCVINFYKFTQTGSELARLLADNPEENYFQRLQAQFSYHFLIN